MAARIERLMDAGRLHLAAFDPGGARELLEAAIELSEPGQLRAAALHHLARVIGYLDGAAASRRLLRQALSEAADGTVLKALIHRDLGFVHGRQHGRLHRRDHGAVLGRLRDRQAYRLTRR